MSDEQTTNAGGGGGNGRGTEGRAASASRRGSERQSFIENRFDVDFMKARRVTAVLSLLLILASIGSLAVQGLNFGLDFTGGTLVEVEFEARVDPEEVRSLLEEAGYPDLVVQNFGTPRDLIVRVPPHLVGDEATVGDALLMVLQRNYGEGVILKRSEFVGPAVGEQLREQGGLAMLTALALVMVYIMFRFTGKFAVGAVTALIHDVIITLGAFSVFGWSFDLPSLAAVLAVIGYSLNDTIVVSDRIRENFRRMRRGDSIEVINTSLSQTLGRTMVTSLTTLLVLIALLLFGGELIEGFAEALIVGVVVGTYSSIYVAANMLIVLKIDRQDLILPEPEGAEQDSVV